MGQVLYIAYYLPEQKDDAIYWAEKLESEGKKFDIVAVSDTPEREEFVAMEKETWPEFDRVEFFYLTRRPPNEYLSD